MTPIIRGKSLSFRYLSQAENTLHDLDFEIFAGEKVLIAGASGSGKSTLSYCLNGLIPNAYEGEMHGKLEIAGVDSRQASIFDASQVLSTILQDQDGQFIGLSVAEDVAFAMENRNFKQDEMRERVEQALFEVGMQDMQRMSPHELSGGQKQSISLAGVLTTQAPILLFDEPLANLDPQTGQRAMQLIDAIHRQQSKTCIIIEHRIEEVLEQDFDRIIVFEKGRIVANGHPDQILASGCLEQTGLRAPHYIKLLEYAGCTLEPADRVSEAAHITRDKFRQPILDWYQRLDGQRAVVRRNRELLRLQNLSFAYPSKDPQLEGINFSLCQGEIVCLLGANGAGKSTLSNVISGILSPCQGSIYLEGEDVTRSSIMQRGQQIGYVMQNPNLMLTKHVVYDEVAFALKLRGMSGDELRGRVHDTLKVCGLNGYRNWPIAKLSYGQKKRVSIAAILAMEPKLLILDEPTAGQDYRHYNEFMQFIERVAGSGVAILFITHDMHLALEYCERALVLCDGKIIADDRPSKVLTDHCLVSRANLKQHSLGKIAELLAVEDPMAFVDGYIAYERQLRDAG
ncbi:ABC transporter ATP-binding protein [Dongshaea marina]|uniref:ABC transporter ATP-binding protein n=1 Tax=Dongshaea marina TaxID=2047966 RepID=UPI000D3E632A|nr:ABC transporter ATP-binding protein [Dongshaea marina]